MKEFGADTVEPGGMAVSLSDDHEHRLWMLRRSFDPFAPAGYADKVPLGRALIVGLNPLLSEELPMDLASRQAESRVRPRGIEFVGFVSLFTRRTTDRNGLLGKSGLNHADADAVIIRALDWLENGPGAGTLMLLAAWGPPVAPSGPLRAAMLERIAWLSDLAAEAGLTMRGYMSTDDKWPCNTAMFGKVANASFRWLNPPV